MAVAWSSVDGVACLRVSGAGTEPIVVRLTPSMDGPGMAGTVLSDNGDRCFVPRYPFVEGAEYEVSVGGVLAGLLSFPKRDRPPTALVTSIHPASCSVPMNLLRFYVHFSRPMSEGSVARHVRLVDESGAVIPDALLKNEYELWDADHRRLTLLLDPGRIKRGLADHSASGYPLRRGRRFSLVVDAEFADSLASPLVSGAGRSYGVDAAEYRPLVPAAWTLITPTAGTTGAVRVGFDRVMDSALTTRCLTVIGPSGAAITGRADVGDADTSWNFVPEYPWANAEHLVRIDPVLEDTAGNSLIRPFDRELETGGGDPVVTALTFTPRP